MSSSMRCLLIYQDDTEGDWVSGQGARDWGLGTGGWGQGTGDWGLGTRGWGLPTPNPQSLVPSSQPLPPVPRFTQLESAMNSRPLFRALMLAGAIALAASSTCSAQSAPTIRNDLVTV